jgi:hypothetical protein
MYPKLLVLLAISSVLISCTGNQTENSDSEKQIFDYTDIFNNYHFDIQFPEFIELKIDSSERNQVLFEGKINESFFQVKHTIYPNNMYHSDSTEMIDFDLEYTQQEFFRKNSVEIGMMIPKSCQGYPGKEFRYRYTNNNRISNRRVFIVKNHVYELVYEAPGSNQFYQENTDFFVSFSLVGIEDNPNPYINLPSDEEIENRPFEIAFTGDTELRIEIVETENAKAPLIFEGQEFEENDSKGLRILGIAYIIFPEETKQDEIERYIDIVHESNKRLDPTLEIIEDFTKDSIRHIKTERVLGGALHTEVKRYFSSKNYLYYLTAVHQSGIENDVRIDDFFDSFRMKNGIQHSN